MSPCPYVDVNMGGVQVTCLLDTGSMVSTISESCFHQHFEPWGVEKLHSCHWLQLRAANGLAIPYIGYLELEVELCGRVMTECGILVVKDAPGEEFPVPSAVLGMNVISRCYRELFGEHGSALFSLPQLLKAPEPVMSALQECCQVSVGVPRRITGILKVGGKKACRIPAGMMKIVRSYLNTNPHR
uniref:Pol polyprotein n=1 Tax=Nothobranchius korthausae TaxID=1143690 RepID=A0A1A8GJU6_9TELE